ncbi:MAG TPA: hypothetical protein EYP40_10535 [Chromatiales bacterium]|nr:hypothetical protein [Chromatiales bacterium]
MFRDYPLLIGACGWNHPAWSETWYPEDLPPDWRLGFYANEFPVVLVTRQEWQASGADPRQWCEDSDASFRFLTELAADSAGAATMQRQQADALGARNLGFLLRTTLHGDAGALAGLLQGIGADRPLCLDFGGAEPVPAVRELLQQHGTGWCWHGTGETTGLEAGPLAVTRVGGGAGEPPGPRQIRTWVETCLTAAAGERQGILLFDGNPPDREAMHTAGVILDLL